MRAADLADTLKTDSNTVAQMFYTHRDFKESRVEEVISLEAASKLLFGSRKASSKSKSKSGDDSVSELLNNTTNPSRRSQRSSEIDRLMDQNRIMEAIINNRDLRKKIKKLYKDGKLNAEEQAVLANILS